MPITIPVHYAIKYHDDLIELSQQRPSRLENTVRRDPELDGKLGYFDRLGAVDDYEILTANADTKIVTQPHSRRRVILRDFAHASLIDKSDVRRMANGGAGLPDRYANNARRAMNRRKDKLIIAAANGDAYSIDEDDDATAVPLPASQKIPVAASGLTLDKTIEAREILDAAEVDDELQRYAVVTAKQVSNLLATTEVKSIEYNSVKALVEGKIDFWLGFNWIRTELLTTDANGDRLCLFYAEDGIGLAMGQEIESDIGPRRDKNNSTQVFVDYSGDATRIEDEKVVQVACQES